MKKIITVCLLLLTVCLLTTGIAVADTFTGGQTFYIATDDITEEERLRKEFGDAIISNTSKTLARDSVEGLHDALIDLFCLSKTNKIFGSFYSSFTDIAADMHGIEKIVVGKP